MQDEDVGLAGNTASKAPKVKQVAIRDEQVVSWAVIRLYITIVTLFPFYAGALDLIFKWIPDSFLLVLPADLRSNIVYKFVVVTTCLKCLLIVLVPFYATFNSHPY